MPTPGCCRSMPPPPARRPAFMRSGPPQDVADIPPIDFRLSKIAGLDAYRQRVLATDRVRYVGEPVAVVFAEDPYLAEDAADLVAARGRGTAGAAARADQAPGEFEPGRSTERGRCPQGIRRRGCGVPHAHAIVALELSRRPPFRRAAGDPRRDRAATTARARCSSCMAPPRCRTGIATRSPGCSGARRRGCISTRAMSAAASASAASFIPRTCWSARRRCGSGGR